MISTHCILYCWLDNNNRDPTETSGTCLDYNDHEGHHLSCAVAIANGYCCKKRKTPLEK